MHLLAVQKGILAEADEPVDLEQSAGDIIVLSAADTELAALSIARARAAAAGEILPSLRLANLANLSHPMSADLYAAKTLPKAKLVIARLIGGEAYWRYGVQVFTQAAAEYGFGLCFLSGDGGADENLLRQSTLAEADCAALGQYLQYGGADNAQNFLLYCRYLLQAGTEPPPPRPLPPAGLWQIPENIKAGGGHPVYIIFYRAYAQSGQTAPIEALAKALSGRGMVPVPVYVSGLKDKYSAALLERLFAETPPALVLNAAGFAAGVTEAGGRQTRTVLDKYGNIVLQFILSSQTEEAWRRDGRGLAARDVAMQISLPEMDGRVLSRAIAFKTAAFYDEETECTVAGLSPLADRVDFTADLAKNWLNLRDKPVSERRIALIIANYPGGDGRLGHGVGLDTPQSMIQVMGEMEKAGYPIDNIPQSGDALMHLLAKGVTHEGVEGRAVNIILPLVKYEQYFTDLPSRAREEITARWGAPYEDKFCVSADGGKAFALPIMMFGGIAVALQPERAYGLDPRSVYHDPDIVPSHHYLAFYFWLRHAYRADAAVHMGKHGNLEWLPGKALALSAECWPEIALGPMPHIYPFIVNDPGEGTQAKRRAQAVIIDHMTPPLARAETYGSLRDLEALIDEYYAASQMDARRLDSLRAQVHELALHAGLHEDAGINSSDDDEQALKKLDAFLCELKELQIRDGLHIFGQPPEGEQLVSLIAALARLPRHGGFGGGGLQASIARDLGLGFDPNALASQDMAKPWQGAKPALLRNISAAPWRNYGDSVERIELLAARLIKNCLCENKPCLPELPETEAVLAEIKAEILPFVTSCGQDEMSGLLNALDGCFTLAGASGAPTRGRLNVFPMGRNFYALDNRAAPTRTAWELGRKSAELLVRRYAQDNGEWPSSFGITAWGTANMRTGGDDIAQALALIGAKPVWDGMSRRVTGYEIIPIAKLGRPRVDVLLRISGLFRDAFPEQLALLGEAVCAVGRLDESADDNPLAARIKRDRAELLALGADGEAAEAQAQYRIFGAQPGHYGTGVQELIDSGAWETRADLGRAWTEFSAHAYGVRDDCAVRAGDEAAAGKAAAKAMLEKRLAAIDAVVQNQDNREHDILDSGEYYAFEGGMAAAAESRQGRKLTVYHNDHSRPGRPLIKTLDEELALTLRGRAVNPKWLASAVRHGYKGAAEMAAAVDYLFAFAATAGAVKDAHFDALYEAYFQDKVIRQFLETVNPAALRDMAARLSEALRRNLWKPESNFAAADLEELARGKTGGLNGAE